MKAVTINSTRTSGMSRRVVIMGLAMVFVGFGCRSEPRFVTVAGIPESQFTRVRQVLAKNGIMSERGDGGRGGSALKVGDTQLDEARRILIEDARRVGYYLVLTKVSGPD